jgi:hypothetical protein
LDDKTIPTKHRPTPKPERLPNKGQPGNYIYHVNSTLSTNMGSFKCSSSNLFL